MTIDEAIAEFIPCLPEVHSPFKLFPIVEFISGKHSAVTPPKRVLVPAYEVDIKNQDGTMKARRIQIPLMLAW
jgi:hypothetical protein